MNLLELESWLKLCGREGSELIIPPTDVPELLAEVEQALQLVKSSTTRPEGRRKQRKSHAAPQR